MSQNVLAAQREAAAPSDLAVQRDQATFPDHPAIRLSGSGQVNESADLLVGDAGQDPVTARAPRSASGFQDRKIGDGGLYRKL